jgi:chromosome segregation ATPase
VIKIDNKLFHKLGGRVLEAAEYYQKLALLGIQQTNTFNFAMQNKIKSISNMDGEGLYDMLTQVIGTKQFSESKKTSLKILDKSDQANMKTFKILEQYEEKLKDLRYDKDGFEKYEEQIGKAHK